MEGKTSLDFSLIGFIWRRETLARNLRPEICNIYPCPGILRIIAKTGHLKRNNIVI